MAASSFVQVVSHRAEEDGGQRVGPRAILLIAAEGKGSEYIGREHP